MNDPILLRALADEFALVKWSDQIAAWALHECADYIDKLRTTIQMLVEEPEDEQQWSSTSIQIEGKQNEWDR